MRNKVIAIISDRIIIGHGLFADFKVLKISHPKIETRDTSLYGPFRKHSTGRLPSLKKIVEEEVGVVIQQGEHDSVNTY